MVEARNFHGIGTNSGINSGLLAFLLFVIIKIPISYLVHFGFMATPGETSRKGMALQSECRGVWALLYIFALIY